MTKLELKRQRAETANEMIRAIASCGRRFFSQDADREERMENPRISHFEVDDGGRVWFIDKHTQQRIYLDFQRWKRGFSDGGTLRSLVVSLHGFIKTGEPIHAYHFGPWPKYLCGGDLWAYGEEMQQVRDAAQRLGIVKGPAQS